MNAPLVSIVMTYFERASQLRATLESFAYHGYGQEVEVVIVDDGSVKEKAQIADGLYAFAVKTIYLDPKRKWYSNACVPFNIGFASAIADLIVIQNAECLHYHNVVNYALSHLSEANYLSFSCYSIDENATRELESWSSKELRLPTIEMNHVGPPDRDGSDGWYNHSRYNPLGYHFCSAIRRSNLAKLRGFDERYAYGVGYDDNELLERVKRLPLSVLIVDDIVVVHQYHYANKDVSGRYYEKYNRNRALFQEYTKRGGHLLDYMSVTGRYAFIRPLRSFLLRFLHRTKHYLFRGRATN